MWKNNIFIIVISVSFIFSCSISDHHDEDLSVMKSGIKLNDTIKYSDSTIAVFNFDKGKVNSLTFYKKYDFSNEVKLLPYQKFTFFENGYIKKLEVSIRDSIVEDNYQYEHQNLEFSNVGRLTDYQIMQDFIIECED